MLKGNDLGMTSIRHERAGRGADISSARGDGRDTRRGGWTEPESRRMSAKFTITPAQEIAALAAWHGTRANEGIKDSIASSNRAGVNTGEPGCPIRRDCRLRGIRVRSWLSLASSLALGLVWDGGNAWGLPRGASLTLRVGVRWAALCFVHRMRPLVASG